MLARYLEKLVAPYLEATSRRKEKGRGRK